MAFDRSGEGGELDFEHLTRFGRSKGRCCWHCSVGSFSIIPVQNQANGIVRSNTSGLIR